jgi:hypothetical protein
MQMVVSPDGSQRPRHRQRRPSPGNQESPVPFHRWPWPNTRSGAHSHHGLVLFGGRIAAMLWVALALLPSVAAASSLARMTAGWSATLTLAVTDLPLYLARKSIY